MTHALHSDLYPTGQLSSSRYAATARRRAAFFVKAEEAGMTVSAWIRMRLKEKR